MAEAIIEQRRGPTSPFPFEHDLYGRLERFEDAPLLTAEELSDYTESHPVDASITEFGECPRCYFQTSGTSGRAKRIPYSAGDLERQIEHEAESFAVGGLTPADVVLSLASPPPSLSAWATEHGSERLGARLVNSSYVDFDAPIGRGTADSATFVFGTPLMLEMIGEECVDGWGAVAAVFPNIRRGILYGDLLPPPLERRVRAAWGIDFCFLYGSVEADVVAMGCPHGDGTLHPMPKVRVELLPEDRVAPGSGPPAAEDLIAIDDARAGTRGEAVVTDLERDHLPLIRYRTGDMIEIRRGPCACGWTGPRIRVLGRRSKLVDLGARLVNEIEVHEALERALGSGWDDWSAVVTGSGTPAARIDLTVQAPGSLDGAHADAVRRELVAAEMIDAGRAGPDVVSVAFAGPYRANGLVGSGDVKARRLVLR